MHVGAVPIESRYRQILDDLARGIRNGQYAPGTQLPAERKLSEQYGVARATARRALTDLTAMGLTIRRGRHGTLVRPDADSNPSQLLNLVCTAEPFLSVAEFLRQGVLEAERSGLGIKVTRVSAKDELTAWQALNVGSYHLILAEGFEAGLGEKMNKAVSRAGDRAVVLSARLDEHGVHSIIGDDTLGIRMAVERLREAGHRKIALISGPETADHPILAPMIQTWRHTLKDAMSTRDFGHCIVRIPAVAFQDLAIQTRDHMLRFLADKRSNGVTACLCLYDEIGLGTIAACRGRGFQVPKDMSVIIYNITERAALSHPPRSGIRNDMRKHVRLAVDLLTGRKKTDGKNFLHQIKPTPIEGGTVAPPPARGVH